MALLSHPPRRLRLRRLAAGPAGTALLMAAAWPLALPVFVLALPFAIDAPGSLEYHFSPHEWEIVNLATMHGLLAWDLPLVIATAVALLAWPALAAPWERLWSSGPRPGRLRPWWPYLATASLPAAMLALYLAPLPAAAQQLIQMTQPPPHGACSRAADDATTEISQLFQAEGNKQAMAADGRRLDASIRAALDNPPPGAARSSYITAMTGYRTAAQELMNGNNQAASNDWVNATTAYLRASMLLLQAGIACP